MIASSRFAVTKAHDDSRSFVDELRILSLPALRRMYLHDQYMFAFRIRRDASGDLVEGVSPRYTAIALLGLLAEEEKSVRGVLGGNDVPGVTQKLLDGLPRETNLGTVALTLWLARTISDPRAAVALDRVRQLDPVGGAHPIVELAWVLMALSILSDHADSDGRLARSVADRLLASFHERSGCFPHWPAGVTRSRFRAHVACFADVVYPIQALCHFHMWSNCRESLAVAKRCGEFMIQCQGSAGQWWWHFDVRTGRVVEKYPVYAVHQDAMAPMALFALEEATGENAWAAVEKGMTWLSFAPEIAHSLIDRDAGLIWRKVARREPGKLSRALQAGASRLHGSVRVPGLNVLFPPTSVDYECRPYHLGWLLYAWAKGRNKAAQKG